MRRIRLDSYWSTESSEIMICHKCLIISFLTSSELFFKIFVKFNNWLEFCSISSDLTKISSILLSLSKYDFMKSFINFFSLSEYFSSILAIFCCFHYFCLNLGCPGLPREVVKINFGSIFGTGILKIHFWCILPVFSGFRY